MPIFPIGRSSLFPIDDGLLDDGHGNQGVPGVLGSSGFPHQNGERIERFSRKVFVGGLPPDIDEGDCVLELFSVTHLRRSFYLHIIILTYSLSLLVHAQTRSLPVSAVLVTWWLTGHTRQRANPTFLRKVIKIIK